MSKEIGGIAGLLGQLAERGSLTIERVDSNPAMVPATLGQVRVILEAAQQPAFQVGDIVKLRPWAHGQFKWPKADDRNIVTQVLDTPFRSGEDGRPACAKRLDFAIAFVDQDGDLVEFLHDSRMFEKVGSIYDPVTLPDGEQASVQ